MNIPILKGTVSVRFKWPYRGHVRFKRVPCKHLSRQRWGSIAEDWMTGDSRLQKCRGYPWKSDTPLYKWKALEITPRVPLNTYLMMTKMMITMTTKTRRATLILIINFLMEPISSLSKLLLWPYISERYLK